MLMNQYFGQHIVMKCFQSLVQFGRNIDKTANERRNWIKQQRFVCLQLDMDLQQISYYQLKEYTENGQIIIKQVSALQRQIRIICCSFINKIQIGLVIESANVGWIFLDFWLISVCLKQWSKLSNSWALIECVAQYCLYQLTNSIQFCTAYYLPMCQAKLNFQLIQKILDILISSKYQNVISMCWTIFCDYDKDNLNKLQLRYLFYRLMAWVVLNKIKKLLVRKPDAKNLKYNYFIAY